jgi:thiol-disulfide isomerase/thioredoxin
MFPMPPSQPITSPRSIIPDSGSPPTQTAWQSAFNQALPYEAFLKEHATAENKDRWEAACSQVSLSPSHQQVLSGFVRRMPVMVLTGAWCGDCASQCPILKHFSDATSCIDLRFLDRDAQPEIAAHLTVCGGQRVPVAIFFSEDFFPVVTHGDRTLSAYRTAVAEHAGSSCSTGIIRPSEEALQSVIGDWLNVFERVQLILRLSGRLRKIHDD